MMHYWRRLLTAFAMMIITALVLTGACCVYSGGTKPRPNGTTAVGPAGIPSENASVNTTASSTAMTKVSGIISDVDSAINEFDAVRNEWNSTAESGG